MKRSLIEDAPFLRFDRGRANTGTPIDEDTTLKRSTTAHGLFQHVPYAIELEVCRMIANGDTASSKHMLQDINRMPRAKLANTPVRSLKIRSSASCTFIGARRDLRRSKT
jgi:hypothetical protein